MAASAASLQMHLQHSPRKKNFGYEETIRLLELWTHYTNGGTHPELGKGHRTGRLWLVISDRMKAMNYNRGPEECKVRVGNLRAKYTKLKRGYLAGDFPQIGARGKWIANTTTSGSLLHLTNHPPPIQPLLLSSDPPQPKHNPQLPHTLFRHSPILD